MDIKSAPDEELHKTIALGGRILAGEGLSRVSFGHVSARSSRSDAIVALRGRPRGDMGLEFADGGDIIEMNLDGGVVSDSAIMAPRECFIHLEILRARPEIASVVHIHPRIVVALRAAGLSLLPIYGAYDPDGVRLALNDIAYYPRPELIDTSERGCLLATLLGDKTAAVLDGHGIVTVGESVEIAVMNAIALCELAHVTWLAASVGAPQSFAEEDLRELLSPTTAIVSGGDAAPVQRPGTSAWQHWAERDRRRGAAAPGLYDSIGPSA